MDYSKPRIINDGYGGSYIDMTDSYCEELGKCCINLYEEKESVKMDGKKDNNIGELLELQKQMVGFFHEEDRLVKETSDLSKLYLIQEKVRCCFNCMAEKIRQIEGGEDRVDYQLDPIETKKLKKFVKKIFDLEKLRIPSAKGG